MDSAQVSEGEVSLIIQVIPFPFVKDLSGIFILNDVGFKLLSIYLAVAIGVNEREFLLVRFQVIWVRVMTWTLWLDSLDN